MFKSRRIGEVHFADLPICNANKSLAQYTDYNIHVEQK